MLHICPRVPLIAKPLNVLECGRLTDRWAFPSVAHLSVRASGQAECCIEAPCGNQTLQAPAKGDLGSCLCSSGRAHVWRDGCVLRCSTRVWLWTSLGVMLVGGGLTEGDVNEDALLAPGCFVCRRFLR